MPLPKNTKHTAAWGCQCKSGNQGRGTGGYPGARPFLLSVRFTRGGHGFTYHNGVLRKLSTRVAKTGLALYWSASAYANNSSNAWNVNFNNGNENNNNKNNSRYVRLVRGE